MTFSLLQGQGSAQEGGYEDTGVQIECGVPPAVREIQHLSWPDGALYGLLLLRQVRVCVFDPGQGGVVGVEMGRLLRGVQEPALPAIDDLRVARSMPMEGYTCSWACDPEAVGPRGVRQHVAWCLVVLKQRVPLSEVVVPEEIQSVTAQCVQRLRPQQQVHKLLKPDIHFPVRVGVGSAEPHHPLSILLQQARLGAQELEFRIVRETFKDDWFGVGILLDKLAM